MREHYCSLKNTNPQEVSPDEWYIVRFPYGEQESDDPENMHALTRNGQDHPYPDPHSGLIWPGHDGRVGLWWAMVQWAPGPASEFRVQFCRDPLGQPDTTATRHTTATPGMQCEIAGWPFRIHPDVPVAIRVRHNADGPMQLVLAEFKLFYLTSASPL